MSTRVVTGVFTGISGETSTGVVTFTPSSDICDVNDVIVLSGPVSIDLDANGSFSIEIPCTDDRDLHPIGWWYTARIRIGGSHPTITSFYLPLGDGSTVSITTLFSDARQL
jgi:hypothetical protein